MYICICVCICANHTYVDKPYICCVCICANHTYVDAPRNKAPRAGSHHIIHLCLYLELHSYPCPYLELYLYTRAQTHTHTHTRVSSNEGRMQEVVAVVKRSSKSSSKRQNAPRAGSQHIVVFGGCDDRNRPFNDIHILDCAYLPPPPSSPGLGHRV